MRKSHLHETWLITIVAMLVMDRWGLWYGVLVIVGDLVLYAAGRIYEDLKQDREAKPTAGYQPQQYPPGWPDKLRRPPRKL